PIEAPNLLGWVVFANPMGPRELSEIARLTTLDLKPRIMRAADLGHDIPVAHAGSDKAAMRTEGGERFLIQAIPVPNFIPNSQYGARVLVPEYSLT
ncbi:hypothetical protein ACTGZS_12610, partial [Streptococcus suis]